jgi:hypothetical protein
MQRLVPHLWYDGDAVEAARTYVGLIPGSRLGDVIRYSLRRLMHPGRETTPRRPAEPRLCAALGSRRVGAS